MARRLTQVIDLYQTGKVFTLRDGTHVWVQPLNPFEHDTARNEAQVARARISLALAEFGGEEQARVRLFFLDGGLEVARDRLVDAKVSESTPKLLDGIRNDPEWTEKLQILDRGERETAKPLEATELELLGKITTDFSEEFNSRLLNEREYQVGRVAELGEEEVWEEYLAWYTERRSAEAMLAEFRHHQVLFGARWCEGVLEDGVWDHTACNGHQDRMFATRAEVRDLPEELMDFLTLSAAEVDMDAREAKNSRRQGSFSDSSPLPSEAEGSTASTPTETRAEQPGSSSSPSGTPSLSSAGES